MLNSCILSGTWMSAMMTELQRNDLLSEWIDMSREATINNPKAFYRSYLFGFFLLKRNTCVVCSSNLKRPVYTEHINLVN